MKFIYYVFLSVLYLDKSDRSLPLISLQKSFWFTRGKKGLYCYWQFTEYIWTIQFFFKTFNNNNNTIIIIIQTFHLLLSRLALQVNCSVNSCWQNVYNISSFTMMSASGLKLQSYLRRARHSICLQNLKSASSFKSIQLLLSPITFTKTVLIFSEIYLCSSLQNSYFLLIGNFIVNYNVIS